MTEQLWPSFSGPEQLAEVERVALAERGLPASTYELVQRAADLWPGRRAVSVLPDAARYDRPLQRSFAELADDVHRAAVVLSDLGISRSDAVAVISVNCLEMLPLLLAAEAVGIFAPINPGLTAEHARELVRLSGAKVIVAAGPELDAGVWGHARAIAQDTGARALLALRPTAPDGEPPKLEGLDGVEVSYLADRMAAAHGSELPGDPPAARSASNTSRSCDAEPRRAPRSPAPPRPNRSRPCSSMARSRSASPVRSTTPRFARRSLGTRGNGS